MSAYFERATLRDSGRLPLVDLQEITDSLDLELFRNSCSQLSAQHANLGKILIPKKGSDSRGPQNGLIVGFLVPGRKLGVSPICALDWKG
jgi:hypothetical protein